MKCATYLMCYHYNLPVYMIGVLHISAPYILSYVRQLAIVALFNVCLFRLYCFPFIAVYIYSCDQATRHRCRVYAHKIIHYVYAQVKGLHFILFNTVDCVAFNVQCSNEYAQLFKSRCSTILHTCKYFKYIHGYSD